jgi:hypothetical protein
MLSVAVHPHALSVLPVKKSGVRPTSECQANTSAAAESSKGVHPAAGAVLLV